MSGAMPRSPWKTRYFIDTEFTDFAAGRQLISVAIAGEDGREFYGESTDLDRSLCSGFVRDVVLPQLGGQFLSRAMSLEALRAEVLSWFRGVPLKPKPVLCYDYHGDLDLLLELIGTLPKGWKHENIRQRIRPERAAEYYRVHGGEHHALHDARANRDAFS